MQILAGAGIYTPPKDEPNHWIEHLRSPDLSVGTYSIPAGGKDDQRPHWEDEIYLVQTGRATLVTDSGRAEVGPGSVVYVPSNERHEYTDITDDLTLIVIVAPPYHTREPGHPVARHEALRTTFGTADGAPYQVVASAVDVALPVEDLAGVPAADRERAAVQAATAEIRIPFDLQRGPLFRARLFRADTRDHVLTIVVHHIVYDGWSSSVLLTDVARAYAAIRSGREPVLPELPVQFGDFAAWQRANRGPKEFEAQLGYWAQRLAGLPTLELPIDRPRPAVFSHRGDTVSATVSGEVLEGLRELARRHGASLYMVLIAAYSLLLTRYTGQEDVGVGSTVAGRVRPELEHLVGFFVNMVVLRVDLSGDPSFAELLDRVREVVLAAWRNEEVPFGTVVERLQPPRDPSRNPLFQVGLQLRRQQVPGEESAPSTPDFPGLEVEMLDLHTGQVQFDLGITVTESPDQIRLLVEYASDLFDRRRMQRLTDHFVRVLSAVAADPAVRLSRVELLSGVERGRVVVGWQGVGGGGVGGGGLAGGGGGGGGGGWGVFVGGGGGGGGEFGGGGF